MKASQVRRAAKLMGRPKKTSILFEKGVIWSGTQNEAVMNTYANLALLLGSLGSPGRVFGRQGGHQSAYMYDFDWPHPQDGDLRRNLWQELSKGTIDLLIFAICNPLRMQQQATQLAQFAAKVPFIVDINVRPSDVTKIADVVLPAAAWGEYTYTRENLERRLRVNQQFYDPPGQVVPEYLIFVRLAQHLATKYNLVDPAEWQFASWEDVFNAMRQTSEGKAVGIDQITPQELASLGTNGIQEPIKRQGNTLIGTERMYTDKFATDDGKARFVPHDQQWTAADPLAFLPEPVKPNAKYPFFVTTIRYQTVWQSGYTYRYLKDLAEHSVPFMEFMVNPKDAKKAGLKPGDWAEVANQFGRCQGVVNVTDMVQPGLIGAIFGWQGPSDNNPFGMPQYYANNLVAGGDAQQKSNGAFFKNARGSLRKLNRAPRTASNTPGLSEKQRYGTRQRTGGGRQPRLQGQELRLAPAVTQPLSDGWGREIRSVRLSVTDRCNFRCRYCMPAEGLQWLAKPEILTFEELHRLVTVMAAMGVSRGPADRRRAARPSRPPRPRADAWRRCRASTTSRSPPTASSSIAWPARWPTPGCAGSTSHSTRCRTPASPRSPAATRSTASSSAWPPPSARTQAATDQDQLRRHPRLLRDRGPRAGRAGARRRPFVVRFIEFMPLDADERWDADQVLSGAEIRAIIEEPLAARGDPGRALVHRATLPLRRRRRRARLRQPRHRAVLLELRPHPPDRRRTPSYLPVLAHRMGSAARRCATAPATQSSRR